MVTYSDSGSEAIADINAALLDVGSEVVVGNESGSSVASKLNGVFGSAVVTDQQSGSSFAQDVDDAFSDMGGDTPPVSLPTLRFLHISDTHGSTTALSQCKTLMDDDDEINYLLITGDMSPYGSGNNYGSTTVSIIRAISEKVLMVAGNHDIYDNPHSNLGSSIYVADDKIASEKNWMKSVMGNNVTFGSDGAQGLYWHKDIPVGTHKLRIIGIEDYAANGQARNSKVFTEAMVNWLIARLGELTSADYVLFMAHTPPFENETAPDAIAQAMAPQNATEANGQKLFVSELHERWYNIALRDYNLMPRILHAYMHKQSINFTYTTNTATESTFQVVADFSQNEPATVVGWASGHIHDDYVGYAPYTEQGWDDILLLGVTAGDSSIQWSAYDDLLYNHNSSNYAGTQWASSEPSYRINELIFDFTAGTLTVKRHGNKTTADVSGRSYGGRVRNEVTFMLRKENDND